MRVVPKVEPCDAWQYDGMLGYAPEWVQSRCEYRSGSLVVLRKSGPQVVNIRDWLIRNLDGDPEWVTDEEMRKTYVQVA